MRLRRGSAAACSILLSLACAAPAEAQIPELLQPPPSSRPGVPTYSNPVLAGDFPDPSAIRTSEGWWAVVTSGGWRPPFTIIHSADLVNWHVAGRVLRRRPPWARGDFWAPELTVNGGRYLVYYAARSRQGQRCLGVASAARPVGFFRDSGRPIVCSRLGAIDPLPVRDERGKPHLVWKEDGNAHGLPTPILAAPLSDDGLRLMGPPRELFRNDAPWEGRVVEAPALTRHDGRMYMFYSARGCCGPTCDYMAGVARSPTLYGRWEKHPGPIHTSNGSFRCPGHVSVVDTPGDGLFLLYHAYSLSQPVQVGRQLLLDRVEWTAADWPRLNDGRGPSTKASSPLGKPQLARRPRVHDEFQGRWLDPGWHWPTDRPRLRLDRSSGGRLLLGRAPLGPGMVARQPAAAHYTAETLISAFRRGAHAGLVVNAGAGRALGVERRRGRAVLWQFDGRRQRDVARIRVPAGRARRLRLRAVESRFFTIHVAVGRRWRRVGPTGYQPPWSMRAPRVGLRVAGGRRASGAFEFFRLQASK